MTQQRFTLEPPPGLFSDDTTFASPGVWSDGQNIRFRLKKPEVVGGWGKAFPDLLTGVCRNVLSWTSNDGAQAQAFGTHSKLQVYQNGALHDITPAGLAVGNEHSSAGSPGYGSGLYGMGTYSTPASDYYARTWSLDNFGEWLIANPRGGAVYFWELDPTNLAVVVPDAPTQVNSILSTTEQQLMAFGCNEAVSGNFNPLCIRWSGLRDMEAWNPLTDPTSGEYVLDGGGRIVAARKMGSYIGVWTERAFYRGEYTGDLSNLYRFDRVADNCGLIAPNAVHVIEQTGFWVSPDLQLRAGSIGSPPQIVPCPIWKDFVDNIEESQKEKIVSAGVSKFGEWWIHYPDSRDGNENSRALFFNITDGTWSKFQEARSAAVDAGVAPYPIMISPMGSVYYHEYGQTADGEPLNWFLQSSDQYIGSGEQSMQVQGIRPDFENQQGPVSLTISLKRYPNSVATEKGPFLLEVGREKRDFRATGNIISARFEGDAYMRVGKPVFPLVRAGTRA